MLAQGGSPTAFLKLLDGERGSENYVFYHLEHGFLNPGFWNSATKTSHLLLR